ncbi:hypothetical protein A3C23_01605 [Candidatus Roizmanbacteria bacterium RIFCSPHIGHO2_02_FULL_37_13b]|uniref:GP-PDE domain-containing protein n=1 Tax=Candidatus Roizmanbacteria bacterium RIFCSPLOWO2_02_FULL_36_11 TaxID=1802071 RepID=A0A1F7JC78_9BACT|nr:MAG: hypothetical protein A3C23_01605 [Candidatus Roizmanbacteria bacterium RIFCSPHIGHO2_02_FULL_37_13b]OGK53211.1 MAG: hypothetical protein A3H78_02650 [Candidatus Roizmanbacteria bacterium RIFCSPLOWO2_02_FULL_36_11]
MKKILVIAHRAGGKGLSENRIETIKKTLLKDYVDGIEIDIRLTKDNVLVVHHDRGVYINGSRIWIDKVEYSTIKHLGVPTFKEVLNLFNESKKIINIDIKEERCIKPMIEIIKHGHLNNTYFIDCFDVDALLKLQHEIPKGEYFLSLNPKDTFDFNRRFFLRVLMLLMALLFSQFIVYFLRKKVQKVKINGISIYHKFATKTFIRDLKSFNFKVFVWGTDRELEIQKFILSDVDGIKTSNVSYFKEIN